jgi:hypothetical protein
MLRNKIWHTLDFEFENLAATCNYDDFAGQLFPATLVTHEDPVVRKNLPTRITNLCNVLFSDSYFRECIKTKTEWYFSSLEVLFATLAYLPTFAESARAVILDPEGIDIALSRMRECRSLVRLDVHGENDRVLDLDSIHRYLPSLKMLKIWVPSRLTGSLADVEGLDEFTLDASMSSDYLDLQELLPIASAKTLSRLSFADFYLEPYGAEFLKTFTNLKHLHVRRMRSNETLFYLLEHLPKGLDSLKVSVTVRCPRQHELMSEMGIDENLDFLSCLCLAHLKTISLEIHCEAEIDDNFASNYIDGCMEVGTEMAKTLQYLEDVEIWGGLDVERVHVLGQLQNLKRLRWVISEDRYVKGKGSQDLTSQVFEVFTQIGKQMESVKVEIVSYKIANGKGINPDSDDGLSDEDSAGED